MSSSRDDPDDLPPPPQGSELHARLNAGNGTGSVNHRWIPISSHTAKCDLCLEHNKSVCQRCSSCNRQLCRKCIYTAQDDGVHNFNEADLDWTPAAPVKRGPRAPLTSTAALSITGRHASAPTARSINKFRVYKPSAPLVPNWSRSGRAASDDPAHAPGAGRVTRSGSQRLSGKKPVPVARSGSQHLSGTKPVPAIEDLSPVNASVPAVRGTRSGTKRVRSDENKSPPSTPKKLKGEGLFSPQASPKPGNSFFPKPATPQTGGKLTIRINSDKIIKTASGTKKTTKSSGFNTASNSSSTMTSSSATTSSASVTKTAVTTSSSCATASSSVAAMSSFSSNGHDDEDDFNGNERRYSVKEPTTKDALTEDFAVDDFTMEDIAINDAPAQESLAHTPAVQAPMAQKSTIKDPKNTRSKPKEALEEEEREKKKAWETNEILLNLRLSGQEDEAREMLEGAYALLDLSMGR